MRIDNKQVIRSMTNPLGGPPTRFRNALASLLSATCDPSVRRTHFRHVLDESAHTGRLLADHVRTTAEARGILDAAGLDSQDIVECVIAGKHGLDPDHESETHARRQLVIETLVPLTVEALLEAELILAATGIIGAVHSTARDKSLSTARTRIIRHISRLTVWPDLPFEGERLLGAASGAPLTWEESAPAPKPRTVGRRADDVTPDEMARMVRVVRAFARRQVSDPHLAEDIAAEAFARVLHYGADFTVPVLQTTVRRAASSMATSAVGRFELPTDELPEPADVSVEIGPDGLARDVLLALDRASREAPHRLATIQQFALTAAKNVIVSMQDGDTGSRSAAKARRRELIDAALEPCPELLRRVARSRAEQLIVRAVQYTTNVDDH